MTGQVKIHALAHLLPNLPEADRLGEQRLAHDLELVAVPQPPPPGIRDLDGQGLDFVLPPRPSGKASASVVPEAQPDLRQTESELARVKCRWA